MKLTWNDTEKYFTNHTVWVDETAIYWYQLMWQLLEENNYTIFNSRVEKLVVHSRIYALIKIYREFCYACYDENPEFDDDLESLVEDNEDGDYYVEEKRHIYRELIEDESAEKTIFQLLKENLGREKTFASLWVIHDEECFFDSFGDYEEALSDMLNDVTPGKMKAYEWLAERM
jgi:hypothetical protein